ncbi:hypothetical protein BCR32DRAFT_290602 [Anaeromyces robustus]|uniref:DUF4200 domain-containing protein n=1 Tax=Anaeromyces robustus TaxID=1754192 RepID=A0A1Y1XIM1_9FUNG|nr:hypothetical protein BCR32DRAFT_290602 [Anaeromyces robustus]|eukprot:ORX85618.1 hypothetical protein BCR32DRAFT_290602 [Anaeromyces robustus]
MSSSSNIHKPIYDQDGFTQRQKEIINSCIRDEEKRNQEENNEGIHTHEITALVEGTSGIHNNRNDTFITQRGGKIYQNDIFTKNILGLQGRQSLQSTLLLQKKNEMNIVQKELDEKRIEFSKRMKECRGKQEELKLKQRQIKERVTKFEKFLKENDAKRYRANIKIQNERKIKEQKIRELNELKELKRKILIKSQNIQNLLKKYYIYEEYLQSVANILPHDYLDVNEPHINDIIMRHTTLIETQKDLKGNVVSSQEEMENAQLRYTATIKDKNNMILVYNSQLDSLQKKYDSMKTDCAYLEQHIQEQNKLNKERMRVLGEAKLAINNLYERAESRTKQNNKYNYQKPVNVNVGGKRIKSNNSTINKSSGSTQSTTHNINSVNTILHNEFVGSSLFKTSTSLYDDNTGDNHTIIKKNDVSGNTDSISVNDKSNDENNDNNCNNNSNNNNSNSNTQSISDNCTNIDNYTYNMKLLYEKLAVIQTRVVDLQYVIQKVEEMLQQEKKQELKK